MRLIKARVQNFKSVEDSEPFDIDETVTCLVGKNESGKTALLTALYRLNPLYGEEFDRQTDYPRRHLSEYDERHGEDEAEIIRTWWKLDSGEIEELEAELCEGCLRSYEVVVWKRYGNPGRKWSIQFDEPKVVRFLVGGSELPSDVQASLAEAKTIPKLIAQAKGLAEETDGRAQFLAQLDEAFPKGTIYGAADKVLAIPKFMIFASYDRLPGEVSLPLVKKEIDGGKVSQDHRVFLALCALAGTTIEEAQSIETFERLVSKFEAASNRISKEMFRYWTQNRHLKVLFRLDQALAGDPPPFNSGRVFRTRVENRLHEVTVPFDQRSTGFVWFFSFLALFSQIKREHKEQLILLLDEPGLSLHAKAQADLLRYFDEKLAPDHQVIYTTHSPFMVPSQRLLSVRTVEDVVVEEEKGFPEVKGTKVGSDVLSTDRDTLFPLQAALGYEITQSLFVGEKTLIVEGPSDFLYLRAMSEELRQQGRAHLDDRWTVCPVGGVDKVPAFMSLFGGNNLHVAVLIDFASGQKKKVEKLRESTLLKEGHVLTADSYAGTDEADTEDILGPELFVALVNGCYDLKGKQAVSVGKTQGRIIKAVEGHFRSLPADVREFDHYAPAAHFTENRKAVLKKAADAEGALARFEKLFEDLNGLLSS